MKLVKTKDLKTNYWKTLIESGEDNPGLSINPEADEISFYISPQKKERIIVHYIDSHVALLYRHRDKEIIGFKIEGFEKSFMPKYSELQEAWKLSDTGAELKDFGDLYVVVQAHEKPITKKIVDITSPIFKEQGLELDLLNA